MKLTTNVAGRAVATGLTPTGSRALQLSASAAFPGQTAVATIAQTNVMTLAQAGAAGAGAGGGGGSTAGGAGGAGAGGGGLSARPADIGYETAIRFSRFRKFNNPVAARC
jgi:hypothetical protein